MLRDYWYIVAFCIVASIISISEGQFILLAIFYCWVLFLWYRNRVKLPLVILILCIGGAAGIYLPSNSPPSEQLSDNQASSVTIAGKIASPVNKKKHAIEFEFQKHNQSKLLVTYFKESPNDRLSPAVRHGASCRITGEEATLPIATNPHQFDYRDYLWQNGIHSQVILAYQEDIACKNSSLLSPIYSIREALLGVTEKKLDPTIVMWLHALVLGDDTWMDEQVNDVFQRWGLSHILAISGLHIGIVVGLLFFCLVRLQLLTKEKTKLVLCLFLPVYALLAGGQPSVWRASLMVLIVIVLTFFKRKISYTDLISITFMLLILFDRHIIYHIGFQLSFAVTFGIILSRKWILNTKSSTEGLFKISFVSQMVILPLQLHYFSIFDPLSILLNIVVVPYFSLFVIPIMFLFLFLSLLPTGIMTLAETVFLFIHEKALNSLFWLDAHAHFPFIVGKLPLYFVIVYYVLFILLMMALERKADLKAFFHGLALCLYITFLALRPYLSPYGTVTMLDIGQGDAFVIEMPYGKGVYFIDIGATVRFPIPEEHDREYRQVIRPYLYGQGINKIDTVFLSHEHLDHYGSLPYLIDDIQVDDIVISNLYETEADQLADWTKNGAAVTRVQQGDVLRHNQTEFHVIGPVKQTDSPDDNSLVLYTEIGHKSWVFTGDIGKEAERRIITAYPNLQADILKIAHHGSHTSTDPAFAARFDEAALISLGRNNMYGHPGNEVIETLEEAGLETYRTDEHGAVQYRFTSQEGTFFPFLK